MKDLKKKALKTYMKLLAACVKRKEQKVAKLQQKMIALELKMKDKGGLEDVK